jgi:threonine dehydrogenase-like Zn-dependent dehydrogenase
MDRLLSRLAERPLGLGAIVSHRLPLADGPRGYDLFDRRLEGCTKVLLVPALDDASA